MMFALIPLNIRFTRRALSWHSDRRIIVPTRLNGRFVQRPAFDVRWGAMFSDLLMYDAAVPARRQSKNY